MNITFYTIEDALDCVCDIDGKVFSYLDGEPENAIYNLLRFCGHTVGRVELTEEEYEEKFN